MCEDYRAGATVDLKFDDADRAAGKQIGCRGPRALGARTAGSHTSIPMCWKSGAAGLPTHHGHALDATHFLAEDRPEAVATELRTFLHAP